MRTPLAALLLAAYLVSAARAQTAPPATAPARKLETRTDWVDETTGHRVIRLSTEPGSASLYFHQNAYTDRGDKMFITVPNGLATIDLTTLGAAPCKNERIADGVATSAVVGKKSRTVFYYRGGVILATHLDTHETRTVCKLPEGLTGASGLALNADETLLASTGNDPAARDIAATRPAPPHSELTPPNAGGRGEGGRSMCLFTIDAQSGDIRKILYSTSWLNHAQFSPTDPQQILFCHEGNWHQVDRTWAVRADGSGLKLLHYRTMPYEIEGHEFFSFDGAMAYYDLQTPRSGQFWLAGVHLATGDRVRYPLERVQWSVHYNQSHDGKLFSGDGGGPNSVANRTPLPDNKPLDPPGNGMWMYLFTPQDVPAETLKVGDDTIKIGKLSAERLVNLSMHDYTLEPNGVFSPDNKWLIFRSNMSGASHVYAVELRKSAEVK
jgi:oligogalacturonide lyase